MRVEETRAESLRALEANIDRGRFIAANSRSAAGAGTGVAAGALRAAAEVAPRAAAAARPMLEVLSGGLDRLPSGTAAAAGRGRVLILIAGLLAAGLIYINVGKLQAGDGYARYAERALQLQRENTIKRAQIAHLASSERIVALAKKQGLTMPHPEQFTYVRGRSGDPLKAIRTYTTPVATPPAAAPAPEGGAPAAGTPTGQGGTGTQPATPPAQTAPPAAQAPAAAPEPGATAPPAASPGAVGTGGQ